jgi:hypothetical protein
VALVNNVFIHDALSAASSKGMPGIRIVEETIPSECIIPEQAEAGVSAVLDDIIGALTRPLTAEEESPKSRMPEHAQRTIFKGNLEEVNRFFYKSGWSDGLPIIPPTEEAVANMLTGTDLPPNHLIGECPPRNGKATVEKIAINAVMAGALPTYMPLLIAGLQALLEYGYFRGQAVSAGSWSPCYMVNGPIRKALNINSGTGAMSPGDMANAAIGRAMGLIVKNMGGIRKGIEDMGSFGNPAKYSMVIAENEEESPWAPLHVQQGLNRDDSAVTVSCPNSFAQSIVYETSDDGILRSLIYNSPPGQRGPTTIILIPAHAKILAGNGWSKEDIAAFISEFARSPLSHTPYYWKAWLSIPRKEVKGIAGRKGLLLNPKDPPDASVRIFTGPELIKLFVAGGGGAAYCRLSGAGRWTTKKIALPVNWDKLVAKHKGIVPLYLKY